MLAWNTAVKNLKSRSGNRLLCQYKRANGDKNVKVFILLYLQVVGTNSLVVMQLYEQLHYAEDQNHSGGDNQG